MRMSVHQADTGVTPTLAVATSLAHISASATRASMEMDTLVLVGKQECVYLCVCFLYMSYSLVVLSITKCVPVILCHANSTVHVKAADATHPSFRNCPSLQTSMSVLWTTVTVNTTAPTNREGTAASVPQDTSWTRMDTTAQVGSRVSM